MTKLTVDGGKETVTEVRVEVLVLSHVKHFLPFLGGHLVSAFLRRHFFFSGATTSKLQICTPYLHKSSCHNIIYKTSNDF